MAMNWKKLRADAELLYGDRAGRKGSREAAIQRNMSALYKAEPGRYKRRATRTKD